MKQKLRVCHNCGATRHVRRGLCRSCRKRALGTGEPVPEVTERPPRPAPTSSHRTAAPGCTAAAAAGEHRERARAHAHGNRRPGTGHTPR
jgi:hypothetical protein